ncbi:hypothetical protein WICMUC_004002 [Wickerhamomyces mucosus]|uniref:Aminopeptidase n=1 Tax=Wickerhamomyces mucosus TaxID=1378264 RepID=A0A9P8PJT4_9ASCO|nr:hypothetical protein WICMUC_004002 [Wickerhamomyces mucosus]
MSLLSLNSHIPIHYDLDLKINHTTHNFNGVVSINLELASNLNDQSSDETKYTFKLNSSELIITSAIFITNKEQKAIVKYDRDNEIISLSVADQEDSKSLYSKESLTLVISYIGKINQIKTFTDFTKGLFKTNYLDTQSNTSSNYILATHSQLSFARCIYPCIDEPSTKPTFKLSITSTSTKFKILSCTPIESNEIKEDKLTVKFIKTPPMTTSIFGFVMGDLEFIESNIKLLNNRIIPLRFFTPIGSIKYATYSFDIASKVLPFLESQLQVQYPLDKLDIVSLPFLSDGAMENFGLITIQSNHILVESLTNRTQIQSIRQLITHELIHHWFGNFLSFNNWNDLWFNESFATWFSYYILYKLEIDVLDQYIWENEISSLESILEKHSNPGITPISINLSSSLMKKTQDAFQIDSYEKGLQFLKMISNLIEDKQFNYDLSQNFVPFLTQYLKENQFGNVKSISLWEFIDKHSSWDVLKFASNWIETPGFPILKVGLKSSSLSSSSSNPVLQLSQERYSESDSNLLFHIPLLIKSTDGSISNKVIMTDKQLELEFPSNFVKFNANSIGIYRVQYQSLEIFDRILLNYDQLTIFDKLNLINDLVEFIGHDQYHNDSQLLFLIKLSDLILKETDNYELLTTILPILEKFQPLIQFNQPNIYLKYNKWLLTHVKTIFQSIKNWDQLSSKSETELNLINVIFTIGYKESEINDKCTKLFKIILQGGSTIKAIPHQILSSILLNVSNSCNIVTWKKILELIKSSSSMGISNHIIGDIQHLQLAAIKSIGYTENPELIKRVYNFILNNFDMNLVELSAIGLISNIELNLNSIIKFLNLNFNNLYKKSIMKNSSLNEIYSKNLKGLIILIFNGLYLIDPVKIDEIISQNNNNKLLIECFEEIKLFNQSNLKIINSFNQDVLEKYLK